MQRTRARLGAAADHRAAACRRAHGRGHLPRVHADQRAARPAPYGAHADRSPRRGLAGSKGRAPRPADRGDDPLRAPPKVRSRARARLERPRDRRARARRAGGEYARLRVRRDAASGGVPAGPPGHLPGVRPRGALAPVRGRPGEAPAISRAEGGVLPRGFRARPDRPRHARNRSGTGSRRPAPAPGRLALPPQVQQALPRGADEARERFRDPGRGPPANRRAAQVRRHAAVAVGDPARACRRRAEPDRTIATS